MKKAFVARVSSLLVLAAAVGVSGRCAGGPRSVVAGAARPAAGGGAQEPSGSGQSELRRRVGELLKRLESDSRLERRRAESELLRLGPSVLPLLPTAEQAESESAADAVQRVRHELQRQLVEQWLQPTRVSVGEGLSLESVLAEVSRQSGNALDWQRLPASTRQLPVPRRFDRTTFWQCLNRLATDFRLGFRLERLLPGPAGGSSKAAAGEKAPAVGGGNRLVLVPLAHGERLPAACAVGAFRVSALCGPLHEASTATGRRLLPVTVRVLPEPRLQVLMLKYHQADFFLEGADGTRFRPLSPEARSDLPLGDGRRTLVFVVDRKGPAATGQTAAAPARLRLCGKVAVQVAAAPRVFDFGLLSQSQWRRERAGEVTVRVGRVETKRGEKTVDVWVQLALVYDRGGPAFESHRTWVFHNPVWVEWPSGGIGFPQGDVRTERQADGAIQLRYRFRLPTAAFEQARLLCRVPVALVDVPVEFEVPNVNGPTLEAAARKSPR